MHLRGGAFTVMETIETVFEIPSNTRLGLVYPHRGDELLFSLPFNLLSIAQITLNQNIFRNAFHFDSVIQDPDTEKIQ